MSRFGRKDLTCRAWRRHAVKSVDDFAPSGQTLALVLVIMTIESKSAEQEDGPTKLAAEIPMSKNIYNVYLCKYKTGRVTMVRRQKVLVEKRIRSIKDQTADLQQN